MGPWSDGEIIVHEMRRGRNAKKVPEHRGRAQGTLTSQSAAGAVQGGTGSAGKEGGGECRGVAERLIGWRGGRSALLRQVSYLWYGTGDTVCC